MAEVTLSPAISREPAWLQILALAGVRSMLDEAALDSDAVVRVESIVYDAEASHVSMAARIMPALTNVNIVISV